MNKGIFLVLAALLLLLAGCSKKQEAAEPPPRIFKVGITTLKPESITRSYLASAIMRPVEEAVVTSALQGDVQKLFVDEGSHVKRGQKLARLDRADYLLALERAAAINDSKTAQLKRIKKLHHEGATSDMDLDIASTDARLATANWRQAKLNLSRTILRAPIKGQVSKKSVVVGSRLMAGSPMFKIINLDKVRLTISLSEKEAVHLQRHMPVTVTVDAWAEQSFNGRIISVRVADGATAASFPVEIELEGRGQLTPGMVGRVSMKGEMLKNMLLVPADAIVERIGSYYLFLHNKGVAKLQAITAGRKFGTKTEVTSGVKIGDEVIVDFNSHLTDGAKVQLLKPEDNNQQKE